MIQSMYPCWAKLKVIKLHFFPISLFLFWLSAHSLPLFLSIVFTLWALHFEMGRVFSLMTKVCSQHISNKYCCGQYALWSSTPQQVYCLWLLSLKDFIVCLRGWFIFNMSFLCTLVLILFWSLLYMQLFNMGIFLTGFMIECLCLP